MSAIDAAPRCWCHCVMLRAVRALAALAMVAAGCNLVGGPDYYVAANYYATTAVGAGGASSGPATEVASTDASGSSATGRGGLVCDKSLCTPPLSAACGEVVCNAESACETVSKMAGTPCPNDSAHPVCDGQGACVACTKEHSCPSAAAPHCTSDNRCVACLTNDDCSEEALPLCALTGTSEGTCVACLENEDCGPALVCQDTVCKTPACKNMQQDPAESDIDCGGPCVPCGVGKACGANTDCGSGLCDPSTLKCVCNGQGQCLNGQYCDVAAQACAEEKSGGSGCGQAYECKSGACAKSFTCWFSPCCQ